MALVLTASGKPAEAVEAAQKAIRLDPSNRDFYSLPEGMAYMAMGSYQEAVPPLKRFLTRYPTYAGGHQELVACYVELGRNEEARAEAAEVMRNKPAILFCTAKAKVFFKEPQRDRLYADMAEAGLK
jgi:adenylate cyclase